MPLFQRSVFNKYLKTLDEKKVNVAYQKFTDFFHNPTIIQNIREDKEEQFQYGFLQKLFDEILDYTINPNPDFNLTTELKNLKGAKKADGAILKDGKAVGVIELKGTKTKELSKITDQAFGYKNNHPTCVYIITSNFEKLRFYINDAVEYLDFDLFTLKKEEFKLLYLCLHKDHILSDLPQRIKKDSTLQEENITKKLYKDYSAFKQALFKDLVMNNPDIPKLTLFKKSQKLIDRFLFIFFAEDKGLLPPNSISKIVKTYDGLEELDNYKPLYEVFQQYFGYINAGRPARGERAEIFAFNGGLFAPDKLLDKLKLTDGILQNHTLILSGYDFESEVDVNILGHIFEHSLNEIDEITAEIEGQPIDKNKTKRKKDGVFYTPKYITKYIVDNTVGKLCEDHKKTIQLEEIEYKPKRNKATKKRLLTTLEDYRIYLLSLTICDPACGSGAFLNQALDFLIKEHRYIDELQTKLLGGSIVLSDITNDILENNIYGVDINEESVDIARLSMWLRTAKKGRALTTLSSNIKCGNSLIDDATVAGKKAFVWEKEFPNIFIPKDKQAYHVVLTTHNSRTSQRMIKLGIKKGEPLELDLEKEIALTQIIGNIIKEKQYNCLEYNICKDHVHLILVCEYEELTDVVKTIKGKSSFLFQSNGFKPVGKPLWSQKFFRANMDVWQLASLSKKTGYIYKDTHLSNALHYVHHNRDKHDLPQSKELRKIIDAFLIPMDEAFRLEYNGGFDVVIGNPPYVKRDLGTDFKNWINNNYQTAQYQFDLYVVFIEKGIKILKDFGQISYITPNSWLKNLMMSECRKFVLETLAVDVIIPNLENVFTDASVDTLIFSGKKDTNYGKLNIEEFINGSPRIKHHIEQARILQNENHVFDVEVSEEVLPIIEKLKENIIIIEQIFDVTRGVNPYDKYRGQSQEIIKSRAYHADHKKSDTFVPELKGRHIARYFYDWDKKHYISYGNWLAAPREQKYFEGDRIIFREILGKKLVSTLISEPFKIDRSLYIALPKNDGFKIRYVLALLNSSLMAFYFRYTSNEFDTLFPKIRLAEFKKLPIKNIIIEEQQKIEYFVNLILEKKAEIETYKGKFLRTIQRKFKIEKLSKKLQNWHLLTFADFLKELKKKKVKLSLSEESEWEDYFESEKAKALAIQAKIDQTDAEIDQMIYELYGLTEEEIAIVEGS